MEAFIAFWFDYSDMSWRDVSEKGRGIGVDLYEVLDQVVALLHRQKSVTYRMLARQFDLDQSELDDLKEELLIAHPESQDEQGRGLVWTDASEFVSSPVSARGVTESKIL